MAYERPSDSGVALGTILGIILAIVLIAAIVWFVVGARALGGTQTTAPTNTGPNVTIQQPSVQNPAPTVVPANPGSNSGSNAGGSSGSAPTPAPKPAG